jgi:hypothetical protein
LIQIRWGLPLFISVCIVYLFLELGTRIKEWSWPYLALD